MQTSAEYQADSLAKYRVAKATLDAALADKRWTAALEQTGDLSGISQTAVVMDLDETVLDNVRFSGELARQRSTYSDAMWSNWVKLASAGTVPGAMDFINHAESRNVTVFYVTNRTSAEEADTRKNLAGLGVQLPSNIDTVMTKGEKPNWTSDKSTRRSEISVSYRIIMLFGDDLGDFVPGAKDTVEKRAKLMQANAAKFGERWVLISNPLYGSWEGALQDHDFSKSDADVLKLKMEKVKGF